MPNKLELTKDLYIITSTAGTRLEPIIYHSHNYGDLSCVRSIKTRKNIKAHLVLDSIQANTKDTRLNLRNDDDLNRIFFINKLYKQDANFDIDNYLMYNDYIYFYYVPYRRDGGFYQSIEILNHEKSLNLFIKKDKDIELNDKYIDPRGNFYKYKIVECNYENLDRLGYLEKQQQELNNLKNICMNNSFIKSVTSNTINLDENKIRKIIDRYLARNNVKFKRKYNIYLQ